MWFLREQKHTCDGLWPGNPLDWEKKIGSGPFFRHGRGRSPIIFFYVA
jgi:hypothetical protein